MRKSICILEGVRQALETSEEIRQQDGATLTTVKHLRTFVVKWNMSYIRAFLVSFFTQISHRQMRFDSEHLCTFVAKWDML